MHMYTQIFAAIYFMYGVGAYVFVKHQLYVLPMYFVHIDSRNRAAAEEEDEKKNTQKSTTILEWLRHTQCRERQITKIKKFCIVVQQLL